MGRELAFFLIGLWSVGEKSLRLRKKYSEMIVMGQANSSGPAEISVLSWRDYDW